MSNLALYSSTQPCEEDDVDLPSEVFFLVVILWLLSDCVSDLLVKFTIAEWPDHHDAAKEALAKLKDTHQVNHIDAFNVCGHLIKPLDY